MVTACAAAVFVLTGAVHLPPAGHVQPQAGAVVAEPDSTSQAPLISSSSPSVPGRSVPARHSHSGHAAQVTPSTLRGLLASSFLSPPAPASGAFGFCIGVGFGVGLPLGVAVGFRVHVGVRALCAV